MVMDRYEQHLAFFGDYQIRQESLTVNMKKARFLETYIVGNTIQEEIKYDFQVPLLHGAIITGFSPKKTHNQSLSKACDGARDNFGRVTTINK
jgi:hypothetical protein